MLPELDVEHSPELGQRPPRGRLFAASLQVSQGPSDPERSPVEASIEKEQEAGTLACRASHHVPPTEMSTEVSEGGRKTTNDSRVSMSETTPQSALAEAMHGVVKVRIYPQD